MYSVFRVNCLIHFPHRMKCKQNHCGDSLNLYPELTSGQHFVLYNGL